VILSIYIDTHRGREGRLSVLAIDFVSDSERYHGLSGAEAHG